MFLLASPTARFAPPTIAYAEGVTAEALPTQSTQPDESPREVGSPKSPWDKSEPEEDPPETPPDEPAPEAPLPEPWTGRLRTGEDGQGFIDESGALVLPVFAHFGEAFSAYVRRPQ